MVREWSEIHHLFPPRERYLRQPPDNEGFSLLQSCNSIEMPSSKASEPAVASSELIGVYNRLKSLEGDELTAARAHMAQRSAGGFMPIVHQGS